MILPLVLLTLSLAEWASVESCPRIYRRFSRDHSFCLPSNRGCKILTSGVGYHESELILDSHNALRSKVARGQELRAGSLPKASDMMQMEWDRELSRIAQYWASQCEAKEDCASCRAVGNFTVSQIIAYKEFPCSGGSCDRPKPSWDDIIEEFYNDEMKLYDQSYVKEYHATVVHPSPMSAMMYIQTKQIQRLTQVIWANTWRVGCGYTSFEKENAIGHLYVCNYGPEGNIEDAPVYNAGETCSKCPSNTCCGKSCNSQLKAFDGLCKMMNKNKFPIYKIEEGSFIFNCDFNKGNDDCNVIVKGQDKWTIQRTLSGNIKSIQLRSGEESQLVFLKDITPSTDFCLRIVYRQGPALAGSASASVLEVAARGSNGYRGQTYNHELKDSDFRFTAFNVDLPKYESYDLRIKYKVPDGSRDHILDIRGVVAYEGKCSENLATSLLHYP